MAMLSPKTYPHCRKTDKYENEMSIYLLYGREEDRGKTWCVRAGVSDAIRALDEVAKSYGVEFSQEVVDRLYKELDDHIKSMKG